jgi:outer membrane lipoprotein-sorting protein
MILNRILPGLLIATATLGFAQQPEPAPEKTENEKTAEPEQIAPEAIEILQRLQKVPKKYRTFQAEMLQASQNRLEGTVEYRWGSFLAFSGKDEETEAPIYKFAASFKVVAQEDEPRSQDRKDYTFDGKWGTMVLHKAKQIKRYRTPAGNEPQDIFRIGEGPFLLPIGQDVQEVVKTFEVHLQRPRFAKILSRFDREDVKTDAPAETDYLLLATRPEYKEKVNLVMVEIWVDRKTDLPLQIISYKGDFAGLRGVKEVKLLRFKDFKVDQEISQDVFSPPNRPGWKVDIMPLKPPAKSSPEDQQDD